MNLKKCLFFVTGLICVQGLMAQTDGTIVFESQNLNSVEKSGYECIDNLAAGELELNLNNVSYKLINDCHSTNFERTQWKAQLLLQDQSTRVKQYNIKFGTEAACTKNLTAAVAHFKQQGLVSFVTKSCTITYIGITPYYAAHFVVLK